MKKAVALIVGFVMILSMFPSVAFAQDDTACPVFTSLGADRANPDIGEAVRVTVDASDEGSGVAGVTVTYRAPVSGGVDTLNLQPSGSRFAADKTISSGDETGVWKVEKVVITDAAGNAAQVWNSAAGFHGAGTPEDHDADLSAGDFRVGPVITVDPYPTAPTNGDVTVTAHTSHGTLNEDSHTFTANGSFTFVATDSAGNTAEKTVTVGNIDKAAPDAPVITPNTTEPTNADVTVTITAEAGAAIRYCLDNGQTWHNYTAPFAVQANLTVTANAADAAGNTSADAQLSITNIDKTPPAPPTIAPSTTAPTTGDITVTITAEAGAVVRYSLDGGQTWREYAAPFAVQSNLTVTATAADALGNTSPAAVLEITNIDKTPPAPPVITPSTTVPTNRDVTVAITAEAEAAIRFSLDGGQSWHDYTAPFVVQTNLTVTANATDALGNTSPAAVLDITNIDKTAPGAPAITPNTTAPTNDDVTVTITAEAGAAIRYSLDGGQTWHDYAAPFAVQSNLTVTARAADAAGNTSADAQLSITNIDKTAPDAPAITPSTTAPTNGSVTVTITAEAGAVVRYSLDGGQTWQDYTAPFTVQANLTVRAYAADALGNTSGDAQLSITNIDKTAPDAPTITPGTTAPTNTDITVTITAEAGAAIRYSLDDGQIWREYAAPFAVQSNLTVTANATDAAGNISAAAQISITNIDKTAPVPPAVTPSTTAPTNGDVTVTITAEAGAAVRYSLDGGQTWHDYSAPFAVQANLTVTASATDAAGNVSANATLDITNIDKTPPAPPVITPSTTAPTNDDVTVTVSAEAGAAIRISLDGGQTWHNYFAPLAVQSNLTVMANATDAVGNVSADATLAIANIDRNPPAPPVITPSTTAPTNGDVTVTIAAEAGATVRYSLDGGQIWNNYSAPFAVQTNLTVTANATDAAGNASADATLAISNIDKALPDTPTITPSTTEPTKGDVTVTITAESGTSIRYSLDGGQTWNGYTAPFAVQANLTVTANATDAAGNTSADATLAIANIDKTPPNAPTITPGTTAPTKEDVPVTITAEAGAVIRYSLDGGKTWSQYTGIFKVQSNLTIRATATDAAGNASDAAALEITNIDKTPPNAPTITPDSTKPTTGNIKVTITADTGASIRYSLDGRKTWSQYSATFTVTDNLTVTANATDALGNTSADAALVIANIDRTAPAPPAITPSTIDPTKGDVTVTITSENGATIRYSLDDGKTWSAYSAAFTVKDNLTVRANATDPLGNRSQDSVRAIGNIRKDHTVQFDSRGGSAVEARTVAYGEYISQPAAVLAGQDLTGWYRDSGCTQRWDFKNDTVVVNVTLYAGWAAHIYAVKYMPQNGGEATAATAKYGETLKEPAKPTRTGHTFAGWFADEACTDTWDFAKDTVKADVTLYAGWNPNTYNVAYDSLGGSKVSGVKAKYDTLLSAPAEPTRQDHFFDGWHKDKDCLKDWVFSSDRVAGDTTLYAGWNYSIPVSPKAVSASYSSIRVTWSAVTGAGGYEVWRATKRTGPFSKITAVTSATCTNTSLTTGKTYYYKVKATRKVGSGTSVSGFSAYTSAAPVPSAPSAKAASASYNSIRISWGSVAGATQYEVWRATSSGGKYKRLTTTKSLSYTNKSLATGTKYYYKVRVYRLVGRTKYYGGYSGAVSASPTLGKPGSVKAVRASSTAVKVSWGAVAGRTRYEVWRSDAAGGTYSLVGTTTSTNYTNSKLKTGKTYYYKVRAYHTEGKKKVYGGYSSVVSAKP